MRSAIFVEMPGEGSETTRKAPLSRAALIQRLALAISHHLGDVIAELQREVPGRVPEQQLPPKMPAGCPLVGSARSARALARSWNIAIGAAVIPAE